MEDFKGCEKCKDFSKDGFIVMGNWPKWKMKRVCKEV
jgi:hypothetical protein